MTEFSPKTREQFDKACRDLGMSDDEREKALSIFDRAKALEARLQEVDNEATVEVYVDSEDSAGPKPDWVEEFDRTRPALLKRKYARSIVWSIVFYMAAIWDAGMLGRAIMADEPLWMVVWTALIVFMLGCGYDATTTASNVRKELLEMEGKNDV